MEANTAWRENHRRSPAQAAHRATKVTSKYHGQFEKGAYLA
jgi:hypothetical protein